MSEATPRRLAASCANGEVSSENASAMPSSDDAAATARRTDGAASDGQYPCVCRALLESDVGPRVTFAFRELADGRVLGTIDELPEVWAVGESVPTARVALLVEVALLIAANPANAVPLAEHKRVLKRETVVLAARRLS